MADSAVRQDREDGHAGLWLRLAAAALDWAMIVVTPLLVQTAWLFFALRRMAVGFSEPSRFPTAGRLPTAGMDWTYVVAVLCLGMVYSTVCLGRWGQTLGMALAGIRVGREDGADIGYPRAALRFVGAVLSAIPLGIGLLWMGLDDRKQGWHDRLSHTVVRVVPSRPASLATRLGLGGGPLVAMAVILFLAVFIVPQFVAVYEDLGLGYSLPLPTQVLICLSDFLTVRWFGMLVGLLPIAAAVLVSVLVAVRELPLSRAMRGILLSALALGILAVGVMLFSLMLPWIHAVSELQSGGM